MANPNIDQDDTAERQIAHLREEVARLSQELAEKGGSALAEARRRAATAASTVRYNPGNYRNGLDCGNPGWCAGRIPPGAGIGRQSPASRLVLKTSSRRYYRQTHN